MRDTLILNGQPFTFGYFDNTNYLKSTNVPFRAFISKCIPELFGYNLNGYSLINIDIDNVPDGTDLDKLISSLSIIWCNHGYAPLVLKSPGNNLKAFFLVSGWFFDEKEFNKKATIFRNNRSMEISFKLPIDCIIDKNNISKSKISLNMLKSLQYWKTEPINIGKTNIIEFAKTDYFISKWRKYPCQIPKRFKTKLLKIDLDIINFLFSYLSKSTHEKGVDISINFISKLYSHDPTAVSRSLKKLVKIGLTTSIPHTPNRPIWMPEARRSYVSAGKRRANTYRLSGELLDYGLGVYNKMIAFHTNSRREKELPAFIEDGNWDSETWRSTAFFRNGNEFLSWFQTLPGCYEEGRYERACRQWNIHAENNGLDHISENKSCFKIA